MVSGLYSSTTSVSFLFTPSISALFSRRTKVKIELFPHESLIAPISLRNEYGITASNENIELSGISFITPVTMKLTLFSSVRELPTGFSSPKYFEASFSESTIECGEFNAVTGSPINRGSVNILKSPESAAITDDS